MIEGMLGPETMRKILAFVLALITVILVWIGTVMILMTSIQPMFHIHFWPALLALGCAATCLVMGGKTLRLSLGGLALIAMLWILLNSIAGWYEAPGAEGLGELVAPLMRPVSATGAFLGVLGGVAGIWGAMRFMEGGVAEEEAAAE